LAEKDSKMGKLMSDMDEEEKALSQSVVKLNRNKDNLNVKLEECKKLYEDRITEAEQIINTLANENTTIPTKNEKNEERKENARTNADLPSDPRCVYIPCFS